MAHPSIEELLERNKKYAETEHKALPPLLNWFPGGPKENGPHILIVSCIDSRANPYELLGVTNREAIVLRVVSGRFGTAAVDIAALDTLFRVDQLVLLQHSNCGASHITREQVLEGIRQKRADVSEQVLKEVQGRLPMRSDSPAELVEDLQSVRECGFLRKEITENAVGLWLDVKTGLVEVFRVEQGEDGKAVL